MTELLPGVWPAVAMLFDDDLRVDPARFADHCRWMVASGCEGVVVNGSLGEYEALTDTERADAVVAAVDAVGAARVVPGVAGKGASEARRWAEQAASLGCRAVMCLPPTSHAPTDDEVVAHFGHVAQAGIDICAYNNPFSTRVDLTPELLARVASEVPRVRAVKEFSTDVRRVLAIREAAPTLEIVCGCDDVVLESVVVGATGWIAGFVNAFPEQSVRLFELVRDGHLDVALGLYREMLPIMRWDAEPRFVQAIKLALDEIGHHGGPVRLPRLPLPAEEAALVRAQTRRAVAAGLGAGG